MLVVLLLFFLMTNWWLKCYTRHSDSQLVEVTDFQGMKLNVAKEIAKEKKLNLVVYDSAWHDTYSPEILISDQHPVPMSMVKKNRTIYLLISEFDDTVVLPTLEEHRYNFKAYQRAADKLDIKLVIRDTIFDPKQDNHSVVCLYIDDEKIQDSELKEGIELDRLSTVECTITSKMPSSVLLPDLLCKQYDAAEFLITGSRLTLGNVYEDHTVTNRTTAYVYKQFPDFRASGILPIGAKVDIYITQDKPTACNSEGDDNF